jgi:hypothetical protein
MPLILNNIAFTSSAAREALLAMAEATTRRSDRSDPMPNKGWTEVAWHSHETEVASSVIAIAGATTWNRREVLTGRITGPRLSSSANSLS